MHSHNPPTNVNQLAWQAALAGLGLWLLLLMVYLLYLPGQQGMLHFDDQVNLEGLARVEDSQSALVFVGSGIAGTLSRPVALASFLLNKGDWPSNPQGLIRTNILIHLLNGALLAWLGLRLVRLTLPGSGSRGPWIAVSAAGLWLLLPLLASTTLIIIQRMTSLSATFVIAGLLFYIIGLSWEAQGRKFPGRTMQLGGIGIGTLLAVFTKENGVLLPLYALILEGTLLARVALVSDTRRLRMALLALPTLLLLGYLAAHISPADFAARKFTLTERLLTQPIILWDYVRLALFPRANAFTPIHDDYLIAHGFFDPPTALVASLTWVTVLGLALWKRKSWPFIAFAVFWFLGGHVLESTAVALELYFEHRNYLPMFGPMLAIAWISWTTTGGYWQNKGPLLLATYMVLLGGVLWQTTSLWGQPHLAAQIWAMEHPASIRAPQYLASHYQLLGDADAAHRVLAQAAELHPKEIDLALGALQLSCESNEQYALEQDLLRLRERLASGVYGAATFKTMSNLMDYHLAKRCEYLSTEVIQSILDGLLQNPRYQNGRALNNLHHLKSRLYREGLQFDGTLKHLMLAYQAKPDIGTLGIIIGTMMSGGLHEEAMKFLRAEQDHAPLNPILRNEWTNTLDHLRVEIEDEIDQASPIRLNDSPNSKTEQ